MSNLFNEVIEPSKEEPLAYRMAPKDLNEYVGQEHILSEGKLLKRAIDSERITSLILYGPPGVGKTALAELLLKNKVSFSLVKRHYIKY